MLNQFHSQLQKVQIKEFLLIFRGCVERDLVDMASELSLSRERIRQLAKKQIKTLESQNKEYASKIANLKVEGLAKQVDEVPEPVVEEEITFDFDI